MREMEFSVTVGPDAQRVIYCISCQMKLAELAGTPLDRVLASSAIERHGIGVFSGIEAHEIVTLRVRHQEVISVSEGLVLEGNMPV